MNNLQTSEFQCLMEKWFAVAASAEKICSDVNGSTQEWITWCSPDTTLAENVHWSTVILMDDI